MDVGRVQARRRLVEDVERLARRAARELCRELDALRLAARERRRRLAELDVAEADILDDLQLPRDARHIGEEVDGLVDRHVEDFGDVLALVADLERLAVVARALADLAGHVDVGQEVHLDLEDAVAFAGLAAAALDVEAEAAGLVAAHARFARLAEEVAYRIEYARVRRGIRARRAADGLLVDVDDLVDVLESLDLLVLARLALHVVEARGDALVENLVDERRLARARDARDERQGTERELDRQVLEVVLCCADDFDELAVPWAALLRDRDEFAAREIGARDGVGVLLDLLGRALGDDATAVRAGARADVDDVVGRVHRVLVVFDDDQRIAEIAQVLERREQAVVVALVQADARLVEDVEDALQARADLRREADALRLAARKRAC